MRLVAHYQREYKGIDVSSHNGTINWKKVKNDGIEFAIIRCGYGKDYTYQDDSYFKTNVEECEKYEIPYGIYLYSYALTTDDAKSEAKHVLRLLEETSANPTFGIWFDMEDADNYKSKNGMPSNSTLVKICKKFCDKIIANGYNCGIYASLFWFNTKLNSSTLDDYEKWVAQWNSKCTYTKDYGMWQYSASGSVNGISGRVDMDIAYKTFL